MQEGLIIPPDKPRCELYLGDCREVLRELSDASVDAVVTDPPYHLTQVSRGGSPRTSGTGPFGRVHIGERGFMGKTWDGGGIAFELEIWEQCLRVLKPGGHLLAFGGCRTYHRLACAIEDAGFEIRDSILAWVYASGFPKSSRPGLVLDRHLSKDVICRCASSKHSNDRTVPLRQILDHICTVGLSGQGVDVDGNAKSDSGRQQCSQVGCLQDSRLCDGFLRRLAMVVLTVSQQQEYAQVRSHFAEHEDDRGNVLVHNLFQVLCNDLPAMLDCLSLAFLQNVSQWLAECKAATDPVAGLHKMLSKLVGSLDVEVVLDDDKLASRNVHICSLVSCLPLSILQSIASEECATIVQQSELHLNCGKIRSFIDHLGTALKPAHEPIVVARKPLDGTIAQNILKHGVGGINVDGCRVGTSKNIPASPRRAEQGPSYGDLSKDPGTGSGWNENVGRWPPNLLLVHHPDCRMVGTRKEPGYAINRWTDGAKPFGGGAGHPYEGEKVPDREVEVWECVEGCPVKELDRQSGELKSGDWPTSRNTPKFQTCYGEFQGQADVEVRREANSGSASRFFPCFHYCAKASREEREAGCESLPVKAREDVTGREPDSAGQDNPRAGVRRQGAIRNTHSTVKPIDLMRWLVRLVTPPDGTVIDPFLGSGTTGIACWEERFSFIGIEKEPEYFEIAKARIAHARRQGRLF